MNVNSSSFKRSSLPQKRINLPTFALTLTKKNEIMTNTLTNLVKEQAAKYGSREAFSFREENAEENVATSWKEFDTQVDNGAFALEILGIAPGEHIGVFSANRPQNLILDFASYAIRGVPVSIYSTSSQDQVEYIVDDAQIKVLGVGNRKQYEIARAAMSRCRTLEHIIALSNFDIDADDHTTLTFAQFLSLGAEATDACRAEVTRRRGEATPDDVATLIYTSGTTGEPKGAILPHSCFNAAMEIHRQRLNILSDSDTSVTFLPMSHIFEKAWTYFCLYMGMKVFINLDPHNIQDTLRRERPTCMCSVPRFWEKVYTGIQDKLSRVSAFKRVLMNQAVKVGRRRNLHYKRLGLKVPRWLELRYKFFDREIFAPMRRVVGVDRGRMFPTAGAPLSSNITEYLIACGIPLEIGYGLSETTATVTCFPFKDYRIGSVGTKMPLVEVKIGSDNEVLVKGPTVMRGYHNKPEATIDAFTPDGWLRTGDAGSIDNEGNLTLTERLKDLFKTSNGKYIAPQAIESRLGEDPYIEQVAVIGDQRKFVTAIIIPAFDRLKQYARTHNIKWETLEQLVDNPLIKHMIERRIDRLQRGFAQFERIKRFVLLPKAFTIEAGELTNTLKLRRPVIASHYAGEIESMYSY